MSTIAERARQNLGLHYYEQPNFAESVGELHLAIPTERQYVLRCPIQIPGHDMTVPEEMQWCGEFIELALRHQRDAIGVGHPYAYLTIRSGLVDSVTDDVLHVDGFSMKVPHAPEQNYIWSNTNPTIVEAYSLVVPEYFDPLVHNLQYLIGDMRPDNVQQQAVEANHVYVLDPYVFHRRPIVSPDTVRTFLRLSLTAIPIDDTNNHINPAFGRITSDYDGVADFRDGLLRYSERTEQ